MILFQMLIIIEKGVFKENRMFPPITKDHETLKKIF